MRRMVLAGAGLVLIAAALPATASALSRQQANAVALRALHPQAGKNNVILFGLPSPLKTGTAVAPADPPKGKPGKKVRRRLSRLRHPAWLYWLDQVPYAKFSHKSQYLLVDDSAGKVTKRAPTRWYPTVNGRPPAFLVNRKTYDAKRYRVFTRVSHKNAALQARFVSLTWPLANVPPGALEGECVLIVSDFGDAQNQNDYDAFSSWARSMKIPTFFASVKGPQTTIPEPSAVDGDVLSANTTDLIAKKGCKDIVIYLAGHGLSAAEGPPVVVTNSKVEETDDEITVTLTGIEASEVSSIISDHPSTNFKVKVDACYSGPFEDALTEKDADGRRKSKYKNLLIVETSSSASQISSFGNPLVDGPDNPNNVSEFTNQNLTGLEKFFSSQTEIAQAVDEGGSLMAHALDRAFDLGASVNHGVDEEGKTIVPHEVTNFGAGAPKPKPIQAVFNPANFTTTYTEDATGEGLSYAWSAKFDEDTPCLKGFKGGSPLPKQATWYHADITVGGPCDHQPKQLGLRGHKGIVTVIYGNADWTCTATYSGTQGDNGKTTGDGDPPPPCKQR